MNYVTNMFFYWKTYMLFIFLLIYALLSTTKTLVKYIYIYIYIYNLTLLVQTKLEGEKKSTFIVFKFI